MFVPALLLWLYCLARMLLSIAQDNKGELFIYGLLAFFISFKL